MMNELEKLKNKVLGKSHDELISVVRLMQLCGGYSQFLKLPIIAMKPLLEALGELEKRQNKTRK